MHLTPTGRSEKGREPADRFKNQLRQTEVILRDPVVWCPASTDRSHQSCKVAAYNSAPLYCVKPSKKAYISVRATVLIVVCRRSVNMIAGDGSAPPNTIGKSGSEYHYDQKL